MCRQLLIVYVASIYVGSFVVQLILRQFRSTMCTQVVSLYGICVRSSVVQYIRRKFGSILYTQAVWQYIIYVGSSLVYYIRRQFVSILYTQGISQYTMYVDSFIVHLYVRTINCTQCISSVLIRSVWLRTIDNSQDTVTVYIYTCSYVFLRG